MTDSSPRFSGSAALAYSIQHAEQSEVIPKLQVLLERFPHAHDQELLSFLASNARIRHLHDLQSLIAQKGLFDRANPPYAGQALADTFSTQFLAALVPSVFKVNREGTPGSVRKLFQWGAEQLHSFGREQAVALARFAIQVAQWVSAAGHRSVVVIDSPLGGTIPAKVITFALRRAGVEVDMRLFLAPRLENHGSRYSIRRAAKKLCKELGDDSRLVLYPDEFITGSRFRKLFEALSKALPQERLVPLALEVHDFGRTYDQRTQQLKSGIIARLRSTHAGTMKAPVHRVFPPLPIVTLRPEDPIVLMTPFFWGEMDMSAGQRKINFVFGVLNELRVLSFALMHSDSAEMRTLCELWSRSTDGTLYDCVTVAKEVLPRCAKLLNWDRIEDRARNEFPLEYAGDIGDVVGMDWDKFVLERMDWLLEAIQEDLRNTDAGEFSGLFANALHTLFCYYSGNQRSALPRDRDFCEYVIPYAFPLSEFHTRLVELIQTDVLRLAQCRPTSIN